VDAKKIAACCFLSTISFLFIENFGNYFIHDSSASIVIASLNPGFFLAIILNVGDVMLAYLISMPVSVAYYYFLHSVADAFRKRKGD
jgi:hypothetical protein